MIVRDNALSESLYKEVLTDDVFFPESMGSDERLATELNSYHYEKSSCFAPYMFWDGWWSSPANTLRKKVVQAVWENNLPCDTSEILGIEYWTRTYLPGQYLDVHVDEDTFLYQESKVFSGPLTGSIFYGIDNEDGGFVEIYNRAILKDGEELAIEAENINSMLVPVEERERIAYKGNRLIIFDTGHVVHGTTPAKSGIRQVMVTNVWHRDNPPTAIKLGEFFYE
jgi:hypothetical protein